MARSVPGRKWPVLTGLCACFGGLLCYPDRMNKSFRLGILGSGRGSNFGAIAAALANGSLSAEAAVVVSDISGAGILQLARGLGIRHEFVEPGPFRTKLSEIAEAQFIQILQEARVDLVVLAGFMRVLKGPFLRAFEGRIVNIHPSLLPSFPGLEAWKQALDHGVKVTGCTVHFVDAGVDSGAIVGQRAVEVLEQDTAETLHQRIQAAEHELYPACLAKLATRGFSVKGRRVVWSN